MVTSANHSSTELTDLLLSTPYRLAYALLLLVLSILLAFAGAFLTLDRTHSFHPRNNVLQAPGSFDLKKKPRRLRFYLESGVGGLATGYSFGVHLSTFLALVVPNETTSAPLDPKPFLAVWVLTSVPLAVLSGLFKYVAFILTGITGGTSLALALSVSIHPNLLTRRIFLAFLAPVCCLFTVLPIARTQRATLRLASSATGAFGVTLSIALLAHVSPWSNVWERLWIMDGEGWGTGAEHTLSAGYWLILISGCLSDWALKRYLGGNPDEEWDTYLAEYASSLPTAGGRAGTFQPFTSGFWSRLFPWAHRSKPLVATEPLFPPDHKYAPTPRLSFDQYRQAFPPEKALVQQAFVFEDQPRLLRKQSQAPLARLRGLSSAESHSHRKRGAVKFGVANPDELSSDEEDDPLSTPPPPARRTSTRSSLTLINGSNTGSHSSNPEKERGKVAAAKRAALRGADDGSAPDYSDYEEDVAEARPAVPRDSPEWMPPFLARHRSGIAGPSAGAPAGAVPMTPSLIRAVDRIAAAQAEALGTAAAPASTSDAAPVTHESEPVRHRRWEAFWRDVTTKAGEGAKA
ncbi:hypothetical protein BC834DRAFT_1038153 [Gloeopeniophorella convolvens]|nr:hypothetical protein BC834DRAFT_1038153 [Gloeopeniophorella convolvens]